MTDDESDDDNDDDGDEDDDDDDDGGDGDPLHLLQHRRHRRRLRSRCPPLEPNLGAAPETGFFILDGNFSNYQGPSHNFSTLADLNIGLLIRSYSPTVWRFF